MHLVASFYRTQIVDRTEERRNLDLSKDDSKKRLSGKN